MTRIVIDPGHGGNDPGATNGSSREKTFNLSIGLKVRDYLLSNYNVEVIMTRSTDTTLSLAQRVQIAKSRGANYFCSIHINAGGGTGWESFIYNGGVSNFTIEARNKIHQSVMGVIGSKYGVRDRGKKSANFYVLRETAMPAVLLENLFIDTTNDLNLLRNSTFITDLSHAIGEGIAQAFSLSPKQKALYKVIAGSFQSKENAEERKEYLSSKKIDSMIVETMISGTTYYRVQAGAFSQKKNAEKQLNRLKQVGITDAFIIQEKL
ncbi:N-acetylmuramoyl-L-alanine amidase [Hazenella coriacea]|uniref:N-acetylmuramoyl-L-alanine amidase n=1 Tax=Hazenella coriacea TaxID=1179467 RepID=A0A4R3L7U1_9BACL|nr:N-acetylmuramoyl-L-alanine amidase [Hazenella coriacea]TCS95853.1 N-acetylmuramoyl-L-alanine amidase [Hazenella coriacea]